MYRHKHVLNTSTQNNVSTSLIQSYDDYPNVSWFYSLNSSFQHKLQVMQNKVVCFILNKGLREHIGNTDLKHVRFVNTKDKVTQLAMKLVHGNLLQQMP